MILPRRAVPPISRDTTDRRIAFYAPPEIAPVGAGWIRRRGLGNQNRRGASSFPLVKISHAAIPYGRGFASLNFKKAISTLSRSLIANVMLKPDFSRKLWAPLCDGL